MLATYLISTNQSRKQVKVPFATKKLCLHNFLEVFKNENIHRQFICDKYKIDLYFIDYKLAIECDEIHHIYNKESDKIRQEYIKTKLNCSFIRFNPYDEEFNILHLYNKIHTHIINYLKNKL